MQERQLQSLGWQDPLEKEMATHSSIFAWEIPWTEEEAWRATVCGVARVGHDLVTKQQYSSVWIYQFCLPTDIQVTSTFSLL